MNEYIPEDQMGPIREAAKKLSDASRRVVEVITGSQPVSYIELGKAFDEEIRCDQELKAVWEKLKRPSVS